MISAFFFTPEKHKPQVSEETSNFFSTHIKKSRYSSDKTPYGTSEEYLLFFMCALTVLDLFGSNLVSVSEGFLLLSFEAPRSLASKKSIGYF